MEHRSTTSPTVSGASSAWLLAVTLALAGISTGASALENDAPHYNGTWTARLPCSDGSACAGRLVLNDFVGTWQDLGKGVAKGGCRGKKLPVTIQESTTEVLAFTAFGDVVSKTCPTLTFEVKPLKDKVLEGTVDANTRGVESAAVHASHSGASHEPGGVDPAAASASGAVSSTARPIHLERR